MEFTINSLFQSSYAVAWPLSDVASGAAVIGNATSGQNQLPVFAVLRNLAFCLRSLFIISMY